MSVFYWADTLSKCANPASVVVLLLQTGEAAVSVNGTPGTLESPEAVYEDVLKQYGKDKLCRESFQQLARQLRSFLDGHKEPSLEGAKRLLDKVYERLLGRDWVAAPSQMNVYYDSQRRAYVVWAPDGVGVSTIFREEPPVHEGVPVLVERMPEFIAQ